MKTNAFVLKIQLALVLWLLGGILVAVFVSHMGTLPNGGVGYWGPPALVLAVIITVRILRFVRGSSASSRFFPLSRLDAYKEARVERDKGTVTYLRVLAVEWPSVMAHTGFAVSDETGGVTACPRVMSATLVPVGIEMLVDLGTVPRSRYLAARDEVQAHLGGYALTITETPASVTQAVMTIHMRQLTSGGVFDGSDDYDLESVDE